jgi:hypothetical protein
MVETREERFKYIINFYKLFNEDITEYPNFFAPIIRLLEEISTNPEYNDLWPSTSMTILCISTSPDYDSKTPSFSVSIIKVKGFMFNYYNSERELICSAIYPQSNVMNYFDTLVNRIRSES